MSVAVVIINYGTAALTLKAVASVLAHEPANHKVDIHVVDNASPGEDAAELARESATQVWQDRVTLYAETENHGFGRGCNLVLERLAQQDVPPEYVLLLNPDAELRNDAMSILIQDLEAHPEAAVSGAGITLPDGQPVPAAFHFPSARSEIARAMHFGPALRLLRVPPQAMPADTPAGNVDWVAGAAVLFRFKPLAEEGFFDPAFFLYYEEVDLMRRLTAAGHQVRYCPQARAVHHEGAATGVRSGDTERRRRPAYLYQSWRQYFTKLYGRFGALLLALAVWLSALIGRGISLLRARPTPLPLSFLSDHARLVMLPLAGLTSGNAPDTAALPKDARRVFAASEGGFTNTNPTDISFMALIAEDFRTHDRDLLAQGFWALFWQRFGNLRMSVRPKLLRAPLTVIYRMMHKLTQWMGGIDLPFSVIVGRRVKLEHFGGMILIAERIGDDVIIRQNTTFGISSVSALGARPVIGDRVDIGVGAAILGGVQVGDDAVIGANAVVRRDVPAGAVVGGVPARVLRAPAPRKETPDA